MPRPQFTIRAPLVLLLAVACFVGGIRFERERQRREDEAALASIKYQMGNGANRFAGMKRIPVGRSWDQRNERLRQELFPTPTPVDDLADRIDAQLAEDRDRLLNRSTE